MVSRVRTKIREVVPILVIFLVVGCLAKPRSTPNFLLTGSSAGPVKIGDSKREVLKLAPRYRLEEVDLLLEGMPGSPAVQMYDGEELLLNAELDNGVVYRITVLSPEFKTRDGIGIGSTFGDVKKYFGKPERLEPGEAGFYAGFDTKSGWLSFVLDVPLALEEYVSDETKVRLILVVGK